jgi:hypothetical protein
MRSGYKVTGSAGGYLLLERSSRAVTIPLVDALQPPLLHFLLLATGVSFQQLFGGTNGDNRST